MKELRGVFDFDKLNCLIMIDDNEDDSNFSEEPLRFKIEILGCPRVFVFEASSSNVLKKWTHCLYAHWHDGKGFRKTNSPALMDTKFWKVDQIHVSDFRREADTGDLILFKGSSVATKVMRTVTRSEYDHVAMLLRYSNGKLVILEATGMTVSHLF